MCKNERNWSCWGGGPPTAPPRIRQCVVILPGNVDRITFVYGGSSSFRDNHFRFLPKSSLDSWSKESSNTTNGFAAVASCRHFLIGGEEYKELNDCIRNTTAVCNPIQNSVRDKIQSETKFSPRQNPRIFFFIGKLFCQKKISDFVLDWILSQISSALFWAVSHKSMLIITKSYVPQSPLCGLEHVINYTWSTFIK